jgi:hypothetical protein
MGLPGERPKPNVDTGGEFLSGVWRRRLTT